MSHVILRGPITAEDIWLAFEPTEFSEKGCRFKAEAAYLSHDKETVLIRSLTVERGFTKSFLVRIQEKDGLICIGLEKLVRPDVSDAVKRLIGLYAWKILQIEPEATVESTNIPDFLGEPRG